MDKNDVVDFHVGDIDEMDNDAPLTPPGPEMRKQLENATPHCGV